MICVSGWTTCPWRAAGASGTHPKSATGAKVSRQRLRLPLHPSMLTSSLLCSLSLLQSPKYHDHSQRYQRRSTSISISRVSRKIGGNYRQQNLWSVGTRRARSQHTAACRGSGRRCGRQRPSGVRHGSLRGSHSSGPSLSGRAHHRNPALHQKSHFRWPIEIHVSHAI